MAMSLPPAMAMLSSTKARSYCSEVLEVDERRDALGAQIDDRLQRLLLAEVDGGDRGFSRVVGAGLEALDDLLRGSSSWIQTKLVSAENCRSA